MDTVYTPYMSKRALFDYLEALEVRVSEARKVYETKYGTPNESVRRCPLIP